MLTPAQLEARRSGIGGSDAAAVMGLNPYRTPLAAYLEKVGEIDPPDLGDVEAVHWGNVLEDIVAREFAAREGLKVRRVNKTLRHPNPKLDFMLAHIDRAIVGERVGLEVKTTGFFAGRELGEGDQIPDTWLAQIGHYMEVTGFEAFYIAALVGGQKLKTYRIDRDPELAEMLVERETWFWRECVQRRMPPPPTTVEDLALLYRADNGGTVQAAPEIEEAVEELRYAKAQAKELERDVTELEFRVKGALGENAVLVDAYGNTLATWKTQTSRRLDQARLKKEAPDIVERFTAESSFRVLRLKEPKQ